MITTGFAEEKAVDAIYPSKLELRYKQAVKLV